MKLQYCALQWVKLLKFLRIKIFGTIFVFRYTTKTKQMMLNLQLLKGRDSLQETLHLRTQQGQKNIRQLHTGLTPIYPYYTDVHFVVIKTLYTLTPNVNSSENVKLLAQLTSYLATLLQFSKTVKF